jgi:hypothetical protein
VQHDASRLEDLASSVILLFLAAWAVASGPAPRLHNADSLIPVFVSLESWSLFYWCYR